MANITDKPLAAPGLTSYRYAGRFGWIMIGAQGATAQERDADALKQAARSTPGPITRDKLQVWNGERYIDAPQFTV